MEKYPLISVLVAAYNIEKHVGPCVNSIISQTYKNIEVIIVDDGSKDSTGIICDKLAALDNRIKVIHTINGGVSAARNVCLENANGEYFVFIDGDDDILPEMIQKMHNCALKFEAELVVAGSNFIFQMQPTKTVINYHQERVIDKSKIMQDLLDDTLGSQPWAKFYHKNLWKDIRFIPGRVYGEDIAILHKVFHRAENIAYLPEPIYNYYINDNTLTTSYRPFKWMSTYLAFKERLEFAEVYYPNMTEKLECITLNFARLTLDNFLQRNEQCDKAYIPEIINRLKNSRKSIFKMTHLKWYNRLLILFYGCSPRLYSRSIKSIHKLYYSLKPNNFR